MQASIHNTWAAENWTGAAIRAWDWVRRHWLDLLLPPAFFLLAAGITRHVLWVRGEQRYARSQQHFEAALQAQQKGDQARAFQELKAAAREAPDTAYAHLQLAQAFQHLQQPLLTLQHQERGLHLSPPKEADYVQLVASYCDMGRFDDGERVLRRDVLPRWPHSANAAYYEGLIHFYRDKGDAGLQQAAASLQRCLRLDPKHANARYQHAVCLSRLGRSAEAEQVFRELLRAYPQHLGTYQGLATTLRQQGKTAEARRVLARFERMEAEQRRIFYLSTQIGLKQAKPRDLLEVGELCLDLNNIPRAVQALSNYTKYHPTDTRGLRDLASAYRRARLPQDAQAMTQLADALEAGRGRGQ